MSKTKTITMTGRKPVQIETEKWPVIARADWYDGQIECQANRTKAIRVRAHEDGRRIIYGVETSQYPGERANDCGFLTDSRAVAEVGEIDRHTIEYIQRVAAILRDEGLGEDCIANLPAEVLS